ncbi:MAG TPA: adenylosuccinate lyase [Firmicutes bacterium]|nr:adenylosuccinate lyase [Bacillota bacterium]
MELFNNLSPLDHRYYLSSPDLAKELRNYLSEEAVIRSEALAEGALVKALYKAGLCSLDVVKEVEEAVLNICPQEVYEEEQKTQHNIRALVNCIRNHVSDDAKPWVHFTATSLDIMDSAASYRYKKVTEEVVLKRLIDLEKTLIKLARENAQVLQMGRTHGQHAVPITFGFALALYVERLGERIVFINEASQKLTAKLAGAVGAYNASSLVVENPLQLEADYALELGLKPAAISTQIVPPEATLDLFHGYVSAFGVLANLADDMRHLQRSEIGEVFEYFGKTQVGSSTMPHKRNPWNFEHVKSLWKSFMPRMTTIYMDQISEHQRDLSNSASARFYGEIIAGLCLAAERLNRVLSRIRVDEEAMIRNFNQSAQMVIAEPLYILLADVGHPDAHECVRQLTLESQKTQKTLWQLIEEDKELVAMLSKLPVERLDVIKDPRKYTGLSAQKTMMICKKWENMIEEV